MEMREFEAFQRRIEAAAGDAAALERVRVDLAAYAAEHPGDPNVPHVGERLAMVAGRLDQNAAR